MNKQSLSRRLFLVGVIAIFAGGIIFLIKQEASANNTLSNNFGAANTATIDGNCSSLNGTKVNIEPTLTSRCKSGTPTAILVTATGWSWKCEGINKGMDAYCGAIKTVATTAPLTSVPIDGSCSDLNGKTVESEPLASLRCKTGDVGEFIAISTGWTWYCNGINGGVSSPRCGSNKTIDPGAVKKPSTVSIPTAYDTATNVSIGMDNVITTEYVPINQEELNRIAAEEDSLKEKSKIVQQSTILEGKKLPAINNPKLSGEITDMLKIETVEINRLDNGNNNVKLSGKANPGSAVTIYIFSDDPIVITVQADANGNWNYELDKDLADGKHEAYIAETDGAGKIISKSQPIAFVKTAEAASMIPMSELTGNESPIEKSSSQYVLIAIIIMSVFLVIALISIGFLSRSRNLDEAID